MKDPLAPAQMTISTHQLNDCIVVSPVGESDIANNTALRTQLCMALNRWQRPVVIDLNELTFMDSSGLHALLAAYRRATQLGCPLALAAPTHAVAKVLEMTAMAQVLPIYGSVHAACTACARLNPTLDNTDSEDRPGLAARMDDYLTTAHTHRSQGRTA